MALLNSTRSLLSPAALDSLNTMFLAWLSPRSKVVWASSENSWLWTDGSENLDATRKGCVYLTALALNTSHPSTKLELDGRTVAEHVAAWETHWRNYFLHRAVEGIGVEMGSPTYGKYSLQNFVNIADLSPNLADLAGNFLQLWFADAAQAFLPSSGVRGGAHNRVYRGPTFFSGQSDGFRGFSWLYGWWQSPDKRTEDLAIGVPQMTLLATSSWQPRPIITAMATNTTSLTEPFMYVSRRMGDTLPCTQALGPVDHQGTKSANGTCTKIPCKPCRVCRGVLAWSACDTLVVPTTVRA